MSVSQTKIIANHKSGEKSKPGGTQKQTQENNA